MNQLTLSVKQSFSLINDGLNLDHSSATFCMDSNGLWHLVKRPYLSFCKTFRKYMCVPAPTAQDLLIFLPPKIDEYNLTFITADGNEGVGYEDPNTGLGKIYIYSKSKVDAMFDLIQHLIIDGIIKTNKTYHSDERIIYLERSTTRQAKGKLQRHIKAEEQTEEIRVSR